MRDSEGLTEDEINAAVDEINELAFRGLTRDDRQLVFSRDEIKNENIMKLGLLAAEKIWQWIQTNHCPVFSAQKSPRLLCSR